MRVSARQSRTKHMSGRGGMEVGVGELTLETIPSIKRT